MGKQHNRGRAALDGRLCRYTTLVLGTTAFMCAGLAQAQTTERKGDHDQDMSKLTFPEKFQKNVVEGSEIHGRVGFYDFRRWHDLNQPYPGQNGAGGKNKNASTAFGAQIGIKTGRVYGFSAGAEFVYTSSLMNEKNPNANLADNGTLTTLSQGYLQFNAYGMQIRGGRQLLNTPLAGTDQFTFNPRSYQGVSAVWRPLDTMNHLAYGNKAGETHGKTSQPEKPAAGAESDQETDQFMPFDLDASKMDQPDWQIFGAKITRYKARGTAEHFHQRNRYFNDTAGFWSVGTTFRDVTAAGQIIGQYYHYRFQQTESADYGEIGYMAPTMKTGDTTWAPYVRAQAVGAYDADRSRVPDGINNQIYGLKFGVATDQFDFSVFGNFSPSHHGYFNHGQMLHPYTDLSGVIYTDTMNDGLQELGPGWAAGARLDFTPTDNLTMYARYVRYEAKHGHYHSFYFDGGANNVINDNSFDGEEVHNQRSEGIGLGLTYNMGGIWKQLDGLKIGDNLGVTRIRGTQDFVDNRVRFYYSF